MDLEELNRQMNTLDNDFALNGSYKNSSIQKKDNIIKTEQIKRPYKTDAHRNEINEKLISMINMQLPQPQNEGSFMNNMVPLFDITNPNTSITNADKRIDYRQNMNTRIDNFIFDNPNPTAPNPILQQHLLQQTQLNQMNNGNGFYKDSRMIIQDSNKDYYRNEANNRLSQYSPLSRSYNAPISIANLSVNDFYNNKSNNGNNGNISCKIQNRFYPEDNDRNILNKRLEAYMPLTTYNTNWNDINKKEKNNVFTELPVNSNK